MKICCLDCGSTSIKKNGYIHNGKQNHQCQKFPQYSGCYVAASAGQV